MTWDGMERRKGTAGMPEYCAVLHDSLNAQNRDIAERLEKLQTTTDALTQKVAQWESNARLLRLLAIGMGAGVMWLADKWFLMQNRK